jgi:hypothetical protein
MAILEFKGTPLLHCNILIFTYIYLESSKEYCIICTNLIILKGVWNLQFNFKSFC